MDIGYKLKNENPKKGSNIFSRLFFGWMIRTVRSGIKKPLELNDLFTPMDKDKSERLGNKLERYWRIELDKASEKKGTPSFMKAIFKAFYGEFMIYGLFWFVLNIFIRCSQPLLVAGLIACFSGVPDEDQKYQMQIYSGLLVATSFINVILTHHTTFGLGAIGMRIRIAASSLVYRKITRLNHKSLGQTAAGQVVNLLSNDVNRFDTVPIPLHALWVLPFQFVILSYILWQQVGISSLAGVITMLILGLPLQAYLSKHVGNLRLRISKKTDRRVKLMSEIVAGIQVIKMYAWEKPFEKIIKTLRTTEINDVTLASYLRGTFNSCMMFLDKTALCLTVICFVLLGNNIAADLVFSLAQTYNILQMSVAIWFPVAISLSAETIVSVKRLQEFLMLEEIGKTNIERVEDEGILVRGVNVSWNETGETLEDISLEIPSGTLCAIVGPVGAGKSTFLQLLLGELPTRSGRVRIGGEISYSCQDPWLFQSTVRNNILFGQPYDRYWYQTVVRVCALEPDFKQFPKGDRTVVGERGVSLSGGQKARINLARAVYREADIYLFDDPLSAVDTHVGKHLFEECINKHLRGKTRILVTHQLQYLKKADSIVVLNGGRIEAQGTFEELSKSKLDFTKLLKVANESSGKKEQDVSDVEISISKSSHLPLALPMSLNDMSVTMEHTQENEVDEEETGNDVDRKPLRSYVSASGHICSIIILVVMLILGQLLCAGADLWVAFWTSQEEIRHANDSVLLGPELGIRPISEVEVHVLDGPVSSPHSYTHTTTSNKTHTLLDPIEDAIFDRVQVNDVTYYLIKTDYSMYLYGALIIAAIVVTMSRTFLFIKMCMISSKNLHSRIFHALLKAPMRFFDINPSGRILNRFSKDIGAIDEILPKVLLNAFQILAMMIGIVINITISNPYILIAIIILSIIFLKMRDWYVSTAKALKYLEGTTKSPVFSHLNSTLNGITTIRASNAEDILIDEFDEHQDVHTSAWYMTLACTYGFGLWLDILCTVFITIVIYSFILLQYYFDVSGSMVGLAISQALGLTGMLQYGMKETADVINQMTSVDRILQYTTIDQEGPFETPEDQISKNPWPKRGRLEFRNLYLKYSEDDPPVLNNLNFTIMPGKKIGIVGRTGAGKSSLISALFRLAPLKGSIFIDGIDTQNIGLTDLRRKISIIPQEPVLFSATLRYNLDPFDEFTDEQIWKALEQVELKGAVESLDFMVSEGGGNFSLGQRQLVCLARAALRNNKILVLDEATANVDLRTDSLIQTAIRRKFKNCTVLTIAHRLNTIMDCDKVLVMSFGNMVEFDHPHKLLQISDGYFHKMVMETGPVMSRQLRDVALLAHEQSGESTLVTTIAKNDLQI